MNPEIIEAIRRCMVNDEVKQLCFDTPRAELPDVLSNYFGYNEIFDSDPENVRPEVTITHSRSGGIHITLARTQPDGKIDKQKEYLTWADFVIIALDDTESVKKGKDKMIIPNQRISPADMSKPVTDNYIRALNLNKKIVVSAQLAQQSLYEMCMSFREMRDSKLYKELGYTDFGDYCEQETGFKRSQAYNYIAIAEKLPEDFVHSSGQIGVKKLTLLTTLSEEERAQIAAETDLESATVKELEREIRQLRADKEKIVADKDKQINELKKNQADTACKLIDAEDSVEQMEKQIKELKTQNMLTSTNLMNIEHNYGELEKRHKQLDKEKTALSIKVKDLESRPLPVQVVEKIPDQYVDLSAYEKLVNDTNEERDRMDAEFLALKRQLNNAEQLLEEARNKPPEKVPDQTAVYNALVDTAADALDRLLEFVEHNVSEYGGLYDTFINAHRRTSDETI